MTSVDIKMKEGAFQPPAEPPGLVQAFLELDEGASGSDEEFLDFQFRIADANANLRGRESFDHMEDWRASFASLQLKQAHEVAEFALARRKEDEMRIERQAKEITELCKSLEASKLETEQVKVNCALLTEEKLKVEEELVHQRHVCECFRENVRELIQAQERMCDDNMELKRALEEAVVTTARLKVALEEKASELVAWLGHEGGGCSIGLAPLTTEDELSPIAQEKKAYTVQAVDSDGLKSRTEESQSLDNLIAGKEHLEGIVVDEEDTLLPSTSEKLNIPSEDEFEDIKHEDPAGNEHDKGGVPDSFMWLKGVSRVASLGVKIKELQLELERLRALESNLGEQQLVQGVNSWPVEKTLYRSVADVIVNHLETDSKASDSSSTTKKAEPTEVEEVALTATSNIETCTDVDMGAERSFEGKPEWSTPDPDLSAANDSDLASSDLLSETVTSLENSPSDARVDTEDEFICISQDHPWSVVTISKLVESITEELTKLLLVVVRTPNASAQSTFTELETRVKSWANVTSKELQSKISKNGAVEEWKDLVVDLLGQSRQELMAVQQRLCDCDSELSLMDKLQAEWLAANQNISLLKDEVHRLEAQSFTDHIDREEEVSHLKGELEQAKQLVLDCQVKAAEEGASLREQLRKAEMELENSKLGWVAEQDFINSCLGHATEEKVVNTEMGRMEKKLKDLMFRLEENERELGELLLISRTDPESVVSAKLRRVEQSLEDAKASEAIWEADRAELASQVTLLKSKLAEVEHELHLQSQQHVEMLIQYEEEQGHLEASTRSETGIVNAKLLQMELLLADKTRELELARSGEGFSISQIRHLALQANLLPTETSRVDTRQSPVGSEAADKSPRSKETEKYAKLESRFTTLQSNFTALKMELGEMEQKERRAQSQIENLMLELGIAKEEVLRYEVRLQKTIRQAKEDIEAEQRKHEETINSRNQMEWHLCRQLELTEGLEREKAKLRDVLVEFELQNLALQKENDKLRTAYMKFAR